MTPKIARAIAVAALITISCLAEKVDADLAAEKLVKDRLESGLVGARQRQATIRKLFSDAGCLPEEQRIDRKSGNVICTLPGQTNSTIVAGGHFDFIERGTGIVDDWSGASLLPSLYEALKARPRRHTYVFVAFAGEEQGLVGSSRYVESLASEQKARIRGFVNLECLGLTSPKVWVHRATPDLLARLREVAKAMDIPLQGMDVDKVGDDDSHPFFSANIPVITVHSVTQETLQILHSKRDRMDAIRFDDYYKTYRLIAYYLAYLDLKAE